MVLSEPRMASRLELGDTCDVILAEQESVWPVYGLT